MEEKTISGFLVINKSAGPTSFDCIRTIKKLLPKKTKVGHTGTLDDFASGLLIICVGREATRQASKLMGLDKEYVVKAKLGELTDSLDRTGTVIEQQEFMGVTREQLLNAMKSLCPSYLQVPPVFSALKHEGSPLYKLARHKQLEMETLEQIVQQKSREVFIKQIELLDFEAPFFTFKATVSKGTYVRSLANDIAQKLGIAATTYELERTKINGLTLEQARPITDFQKREDVEAQLIDAQHVIELLAC